MRGISLAGATVALAAALSTARPARCDPPRDVASLFFIAKSENRNQVHYGIHLDAGCAPAGELPVFAYWRMLERGPGATEPLLSREVAAYGLVEQRVVERRVDGGRVVVRLHALPDRPIEIATVARGGTCEFAATTPIEGAPAALTSVFVQLRWPFGVDHLLLSGRALVSGRALREHLER